MNRTALVTGANRGIGLEVCRQLAAKDLDVVLSARDADAGRKAAASLGVRFEPLDVADGRSLEDCVARLKKAKVEVEILVNNAGVYPGGTTLSTSEELFREAFDINFWGAYRTCRAFLPGMVRRGSGRIVNVSSGYGSFEGGLAASPAAYGISKAALNALTLKLSAEVSEPDVKINVACPGWVRTRMGGSGAPLGVEDGADTIVWLATLPKSGPTGGFFEGRKRIAW